MEGTGGYTYSGCQTGYCQSCPALQAYTPSHDTMVCALLPRQTPGDAVDQSLRLRSLKSQWYICLCVVLP